MKFKMKTMKPNLKTFPHFHFLALILLAAIAALALATTHVFAGEASSKLDAQIVLALKQSRGQPPFDKPTLLQPDIPIKDNAGRVLVDIAGSVSPQLLNQVASGGGQVINGSVTATSLRAMVPLSQLENLAGRADVTSISPSRPTITSGIKAAP